MTAGNTGTRLGAIADAAGTAFSVYSSVAERIQLCLFSAAGEQVQAIELTRGDDSIWYTHVAGCGNGQRYGYRVHGPYEPQQGLRCNPAKLLIDPYTRALCDRFTWHDAVFDHVPGQHGVHINTTDSAPFVPKSVVCIEQPDDAWRRPRVPWSETVFYEANVRGYTMRHPALDDTHRGTFDGMRHREVLAYLRSLGITSLELMPVHAFIDELHLANKGLRNFWGYNSFAYFVPHPKYAVVDAAAEFRDMVRAIHDAGIEVILDVVYNHTAEGDARGPALSFRGLDNLAYYSTEPGSPGTYINDTGCGNTINADHPIVQRLVLDSLRYWHESMGVDGFRFDLAPVLGRHNHGYSARHPLLHAIETDVRLRDAKLIAEPWDPGPGGYQLGGFQARWSEWNDRYRDDVRRFWRGDAGSSGDFARRLHGSADLFAAQGRQPRASINFVSSHDGFTLMDLVSYRERHNLANGEDNRDGHAHNISCNYGIEGPTDDAAIRELRRRHRLNLLATLLLSQGVPLLLAGDEFGNSQQGNNNAYAQDNDIGWLDWRGLREDPDFQSQVRALLRLRRTLPRLRLGHYVHSGPPTASCDTELRWLRPDGAAMHDNDWHGAHAFALRLNGPASTAADPAVAILVNATDTAIEFAVDDDGDEPWQFGFASDPDAIRRDGTITMPAFSLALLTAKAATQAG